MCADPGSGIPIRKRESRRPSLGRRRRPGGSLRFWTWVPPLFRHDRGASNLAARRRRQGDAEARYSSGAELLEGVLGGTSWQGEVRTGTRDSRGTFAMSNLRENSSSPDLTKGFPFKRSWRKSFE